MMNRNKVRFPVRTPAALVVLLMLLSQSALNAQEATPVPVEISKQKIVADGKIYYMHQVMKGQTLYSISKAYFVTVDQISRENQIADNGIREGQMLRIPAPATQSSTVVTGPGWQEKPHGNQQEASPPSTSGQRTQTPVLPPTQDERYIYHRVRRGETLSSIANQYGMSVRDLKKQNKGLLFPHEGDYLMIPRRKITVEHTEWGQTLEKDTIPADTVMADTTGVSEEAEIFTVPVERTEVARLHGSVKVAVLLPFFLEENSNRTYIDSTRKDAQGNKIYREMNKPESFVYEGSLPFLEAYEGILIAVDSLRTLGLSVELDVFDTGADTLQIKRLLRTGMLSDVDLIIGPVFSRNVEQIAPWASENNIPFVSPVPLRDMNITRNKPTMYRVFPSENVIQDVMVDELRYHRGSNVVFLYADTAMYDPSTVSLWEKVRGVVAETTPDDTIQPVPFYFTGLPSRRDSYGDMTSLERVLDQEKENVIVLASASTAVVSSALSTLHSFARKYDIKVIGLPDIRGLETVDLRYYYDLELLIPAECYIDFDSPVNRSFSLSYRKKFKTEPMAESFAWRGFDIAWYFIGGIATGGRRFLTDPGTFNPQLLCLEPDLRRESRLNGYENYGLFVLHYRKDMSIEIKRPWPGPPVEEEPYRPPVSLPYSDSLRHNQVR
jgi:LysM repeat protein/ABC-type branched-subunit amino acid transport system substrate-binding protein